MADDTTIKGARHPIAFISHHSSQEQTARHLKTILGRNGISGWMAPDDIEPGRPFDEAIIEEVEHCDVIVLLFCARSDKSRHVKRELMMAENHRKLIYPVRLEDIDAKGLAYWLNDYQWIDWIDRRDETIHRLIETVKRQVTTTDRRETHPAEDETNPSKEPDQARATEAEELVESQTPLAADTAPIGLTGAASTADANGIDDNNKGPAFRIPPAGWIAIAIGALVIAIAVAMAIGANREDDSPGTATRVADDDSNGSGGSSSAGNNNGPAASETELTPGMWSSQYDFTRVDMPGAPPEVISAFRQQLGSMSSSSNDCMTIAEARNPEQSILQDNELKRQCTVTNARFSGGQFNLAASCQIPNTVGPAQLRINGTYVATSINADVSLNMNTAAGAMTLVGRMRSSRTGSCN